MVTTNPILRIRRALRSVGASADQADEFASAIDEIYVSREQFEDRIGRMLADHRRQLLLEMIVIVSIAVGVILAVLA
ncbi:MAG: hypothetical protein OXN86_03660 [Chloroflexota bacterium]|nr:hypothetical protein [Chloroflexota bacterium]